VLDFRQVGRKEEAMFEGREMAKALTECGVTHVIWIPDSVLGQWDEALSSGSGFELIRVCREGEAFAMAAGLLLGGKTPIIFIQCTGMFEAGDSLRNTIYDLGMPVFFAVGLRNYYKHRDGTSRDSAPRFAESILDAWNIPYRILDDSATVEDFKTAYLASKEENRAGAVFLAE
jgi:phosphonopyruvate decarboxylase